MQGENQNRAACESAVVELLATWGATALPGMTELFESLAAFRQRGSFAVLRQLLDAPEDALDEDLRAELQDMFDASRAGGFESTDSENRLPPLLVRAADGLERQARSKRESTAQRLGPRASALERTELHEILEHLQFGELAENLEDRLRALRRLHRADELLDRAGARIEQEKRSPAAGPPAADEEKRQAARRRLAEICERARRAAEETGPLLGASRRELLLAAAKSGGKLSREPSSAGGNIDFATLDRSLERSERGLRAMLDDLADAGEPARRRRAEAARALIEQWRSLAAGLDRPTQAADRLERTLLDGVPSGGPAFYEALARGAESIRSLHQGRVDRVKRAEARLRQAEQSLADELRESAGFLPAARVVQARLLVEGTGAVAAVGEPDGLDSLAAAIEEETKQVRGLAASGREQKTRAETSERSGARESTEKLIGAVPPRTAKQLKELLAKLERSPAGEVEALRRDLDAVASSARARLRLDAARTLHRAENRLARLERKPAAADAGADVLEAEAGALRESIDAGDVPSAANRSRQVAATLRKLEPWSRPVVRAAATATAVLLIATLFLAGQWYANRAREYRLVLAESPTLSESVMLSLVRDGRIAEQSPYEPGGPAIVRLSPGEYEIYVNGRYTGRVVRVPADPPDVSGIPVP